MDEVKNKYIVLQIPSVCPSVRHIVVLYINECIIVKLSTGWRA